MLGFNPSQACSEILFLGILLVLSLDILEGLLDVELTARCILEKVTELFHGIIASILREMPRQLAMHW